MLNKQLADDLRAARKVIERPEAWTKGEFAKDSGGYPTDSRAPDAVCFCAEGALRKVSPNFARYCLLLEFLGGGGNVHIFNDAQTTTHADILRLFDRAIAAAEAS